MFVTGFFQPLLLPSGDELLFFFVEFDLLQQVGPTRKRAAQGLASPPVLYALVIARKQRSGNALAAEFNRPSVPRAIEHGFLERVVQGRRKVAQHIGYEPHHRVDEDLGGRLAAGEHIVAD